MDYASLFNTNIIIISRANYNNIITIIMLVIQSLYLKNISQYYVYQLSHHACTLCKLVVFVHACMPFSSSALNIKTVFLPLNSHAFTSDFKV